MADEFDVHMRMPGPGESLKAKLSSMTGISVDDLKGYYYVFKFDDAKIRIPTSWTPKGEDYPDIIQMIQAGFTQSASSIDELEKKIEELMVFVYIPIVISMYPKIKIRDAAKGRKQSVKLLVIDDNEIYVANAEEKAKVKEAYNLAIKFGDAYIDEVWGTIRLRGKSGKFDQSIQYEKKKDRLVTIAGGGKEFNIKVAPSNQIRMTNGKLGSKIMATGGNIDNSFQIRSDGSLWFKVKGKGSRWSWKKYK